MKRKSADSSTSPAPAKQRKTAVKAVPSKTVKKTPARTKAAATKTKQAPAKKKTPVKRTVKAKAKPKTKASPKKKAAPAKKATPKKGKATQKTTPKKKATQKKKTTTKKKAAPKKKTATPKKKGQAAKKKAQKPASKAAQKKDGQKKPKVHPNDKLTPNNAIEVAKKDLMFEEKNGQGTLELSSLGKAKTAIQAVLTNDISLLEKLIKNTKEVPSLFVARSVDNKEDALCAALRVKNKSAIQLLVKELEDTNQGKTRMNLGTPSLEKENTGRYNYRSLGHAVRGINVARGGREGNDAFTKDIQSYHGRTHINQYVVYAAENVNDLALLQPFLRSTTQSDQFHNYLLDRIWLFARQGAHKIAGQLVKLAVERDGYGFNKLHMEVLTCSKPSELSQFRSVSVKKKPYDNQKITPLHLSAINPNPDIMLSLLAVVPEFYIVDKNGYGLIHYAAACEGSGPLEALVARGVFPNQATTMGLTPLMIASRLGRIQNMIFLLKPRKTIPLPGIMKEVRFVDSVMGSKTPLHFAAENGQAEACQILIDHGANIEAITSAATNKLTPIMMAARSGHFKTVKTLVDAKASLDAKDKLKRTPLTHAVMNGNYVIASFLLRKGADPNSRDTSGNTPIHYAAGYGWWHCVKLLLKAGADPNSMNEWKVPPLCIAFLKGHSDCADVLIREAGVGVDFCDAEGWTMVMMTVSKPVNDETLKQLKFLVEDKKANVKLVDGDGWNAMHHLASSPVQGYNEAVKTKQFQTIIECAKILIKHGCDISAKTDSGETPVNIVMQQDPINTDLLQLLLNKGASISLDAGGEDGENVLHLMARKVVHGDQCQVFDLIWKQSAKADGNSLIDLIDVKDKSGFTPLLRLAETYREKTSNNQQQHSSFRRFGYNAYSNNTPVKDDFYGHVTSLMKRFIEKGQADINYGIAADNNKANPEDRARGAVLFYFIYPYDKLQQSDTNGVNCRNNVLKAFLSFKPKVNIHNKKGTTPLIEILTYGAVGEEAAKILIGAGANVRLTEVPPQEEDKSEMGDSGEKKDIEPASPIFVAAKNSLFAVVKKLLAEGASPVSPNQKSNLLHHLAALKSSPTEVVKCLATVLSKGVDVNVGDAKKRTPLHYAVEALTHDSTTDVVDFLLERGANPLVQDEDGRLPLHYAFYKLDKPDDCSQMDPIEVVTMLTSAMKNKGMDTADKDGRTPLHVAAFRGATISFTHLIELVTNLDAADTLGNTPLSLAVAGGHDSITVPLIQRGANINVPVTHITPEYKEWEKQQKELKGKKKIWMWEKKKPPVPTKVKRVSLLYKVVEKGWQGVLYLLMDRLERFGLPKTAIVQATLEAGKMHLAYSLIMKKMKNLKGKDLLNTDGQNMLHVLALNSKGTSTNEHLEVANALLSQGNRASDLDSFGCSALTYTVLARDVQLCKVFIDKEKSNARKVLSTFDGEERSGFSAFFYSVVWDASAEELWKLLCKHGLSPNEIYLMPDWSEAIPDNGSSTSLHHLYHIWDPPVIRQTPLMSAIKTRNFPLVKFLLDNGANVNTVDPADNTTPLMVAVKANDVNIVKLLLNKDFDPGKKATQAYNKSTKTFGGFGTSIWKGGNKRKRYSDGGSDDDSYCSDEEDEGSDMDVDDEEDEEDDDKKKKTEDTFKMTSKANLSAVDSDNRNVFHHLITGEEGTYENVDILNVLAKFAPASLLTAQDLTGHSPFDLTIEARADKFISAMEKITKQNVKRLDKVTHKWTDGIKWKFPNRHYDFKSDAEEMLKKINASDEGNQSEEEKKPKAKVDRRVGLSSGVEVVVDTDQDIPYSVLMTKVDVKYGTWGMNNFYKMQVVHQKGKDMYLLFTCWGRIGDEGQNQRTPFATAAEAIKEFCKIFSSKSGNTWANVKQFNRLPGKYQLVDADPHSSKKAVKEFHFDLKSNLPSELPQPVQDLLKTLTSVPILNAVLKRSNVNTALMPFGQLKESVIKEAKDILDQVRKLNQSLKKELDTNKLSDDGAQKMNEILELSSRYYQLIPYTDFAFDKMEPLNRLDALKDAEKNMQNLVDLELANRILLGAQYRIKEINPLDYIYQALDCQIELLDETSKEAQMILQQIDNTCENNHPTVEAIYRISRHGEEEDLYKLKLANHQLLWHGTKTSNLVSILKRGLLTQPVESSGYTGNLYGQGIYTAPMVAKSMNYCNNFYERATSKFLLFCEVATGKSQTDVEETGFRKGFDSTLGQGSRGPDPNFDLRLKSGASIPLGKTITKPNNHWLSYDEVVLYSEAQVCLRYLVQFR